MEDEMQKKFEERLLELKAFAKKKKNVLEPAEIADFFKNEIGYDVPPMTPYVGRNFNMTRAGIHADGLLKNEEIYNIFDTEKFLKRPVEVAISNTSGLAGIAHWVNRHYEVPEENPIDKKSELVAMIKAWVDEQYENGRVTVIANDELFGVTDIALRQLGLCLKMKK